jgi:hypothetical protein
MRIPVGLQMGGIWPLAQTGQTAITTSLSPMRTGKTKNR